MKGGLGLCDAPVMPAITARAKEAGDERRVVLGRADGEAEQHPAEQVCADAQLGLILLG